MANVTLFKRAPHREFHKFIVVRSFVACLAVTGCVPAVQYEEAQSAAEVEREGHRRAAQRLYAAEQELAKLKAEHEQLKARLAEKDQTLAAVELDVQRAAKQRDEHAELVTQLRGELARVGDHLRAFSVEKDGLNQRLDAAQSELERLTEETKSLRANSEDKEKKAAERLDSALGELARLQAASEQCDGEDPDATESEGDPKPAAGRENKQAAPPGADQPDDADDV